MNKIYTLPIREIMRLRKGKVKKGPKVKLTEKQKVKKSKEYLQSYYKRNRERILKREKEKYWENKEI